jgi:hypothetical protein
MTALQQHHLPGAKHKKLRDNLRNEFGIPSSLLKCIVVNAYLTPTSKQSGLWPTTCALHHLFFLVMPNELPETFRGSQTCRAIVVLQRDARIGVM